MERKCCEERNEEKIYQKDLLKLTEKVLKKEISKKRK